MTVTYGFYDSLSGDRKYNATQMGQIFKGIISDGVFSSVGSGLVVSVNTGMTLNVASGRAWFNNTWTDNDSTLIVTVQASEAVLNRIDAVVVEINSDVGTRANSIKVIKGTPASSPVAPTMANTSTLHQYPLAYVSVLAGVTSITADKLTNKIGSTDCPFAAGAVPIFDFGTLLNGWQTQFTTWYNNLVNQLSGSQVTNLQAQIDVLNAIIAKQDNYVITPTIASNNLTLSIKTLAGTDPSGSDPVRVKIGDIVYSITGALSLTKAAGTNWLNAGAAELAGRNIDYFVYLIAETGASAGVKLGFARIPHAETMGDLVNGAVTPTGEKAILGSYTNFNATDKVKNIGRFRAILGGASTYNWSISTGKVINRPVFETDWLSWLPAISASGSMTISSPAYNVIQWKLRNDDLFVMLDVGFTTGGTASNSINATPPFTALGSFDLLVGQTVDSATTSGLAWIATGSIGVRKYDSSNWTIGAGKTIRAKGNYKI